MGSVRFWPGLGGFSRLLVKFGLVSYIFLRFGVGSVGYWSNLGGFSIFLVNFGWIY